MTVKNTWYFLDWAKCHIRWHMSSKFSMAEAEIYFRWFFASEKVLKVGHLKYWPKKLWELGLMAKKVFV